VTDTPPPGGPDIVVLYQLGVEMADRVSARRATANTFFFSVQAGLAVALGAFAVRTGSVDAPEPDRFVLSLAALAGVVIAVSWWLLLRSYRDLNTAKFKVINQIEADYFEVRLFTQEWDHLKTDPIKPWRQRYAELGEVERVVPVVFALLYLALGIYVLFG
jgi:hypothetical protein